MQVKLYNPLTKIYENNALNKNFNRDLSVKGDLLRKDILSFGNISELARPSQETMDYIAKRTKELLKEKHSIDFRLKDDFDLDRMEDLLVGIKVFEGLTIKDIAAITDNLEAILMQRGCRHQCSHCGADAGKKITTIL